MRVLLVTLTLAAVLVGGSIYAVVAANARDHQNQSDVDKALAQWHHSLKGK